MKTEQGVRRIAEEPSSWSNFELGNFNLPLSETMTWLNENWWWLLIALGAIAGLIFLIKRVRQRRDQIQKLWVFILFFLTKRQMMIPLVITLSQKDKLLDEDLRQKLMDIRQQCREVSLKKEPNARLEIEEQVSKILFFYFSNLEKKDQIKPHTKFAKLVQDLEFIDAKLVQLQQVYNKEVKGWNRWIAFPVFSLFCRLIGVGPFRAFR